MARTRTVRTQAKDDGDAATGTVTDGRPAKRLRTDAASADVDPSPTELAAKDQKRGATQEAQTDGAVDLRGKLYTPASPQRSFRISPSSPCRSVVASDVMLSRTPAVSRSDDEGILLQRMPGNGPVQAQPVARRDAARRRIRRLVSAVVTSIRRARADDARAGTFDPSGARGSARASPATGKSSLLRGSKASMYQRCACLPSARLARAERQRSIWSVLPCSAHAPSDVQADQPRIRRDGEPMGR